VTYTKNTGNRPCALELVLQSGQARNIFVTGYDITNGDPYFRRICELQPGKRHVFYFGMPISPKVLKVQIFDQDNRMFSRPETFQLDEPRLVQLKTSNVSMSQDDREFLKFAEWLAVNMKTLRPGKDYVWLGKFMIQLYSDLDTPTPARIHATKDFIQVSKVDFLTMTLPRRVIILLHEYSHNYINDNPENESEADLHALSIYLSHGYPFMEAIYAFTKILHNNEQSIERLQWMQQFMEQHQLYIDK